MKVFCFEVKYVGWGKTWTRKKIRKEVLREYINKKSKICAVKRYREITGSSLQEAKRFCDDLQGDAEKYMEVLG